MIIARYTTSFLHKGSNRLSLSNDVNLICKFTCILTWTLEDKKTLHNISIVSMNTCLKKILYTEKRKYHNNRTWSCDLSHDFYITHTFI
jgi:hypothetical protein